MWSGKVVGGKNMIVKKIRETVLFKGDVYKVQMFIAHFFPLKGQGLSI